MAAYEKFTLLDLFSFNLVNLDHLTETYAVGFYGKYLTQWPEYCLKARHPGSNTIMGYILGKIEGEGEDRHGHISAITVASPFRRQNVARTLITFLETTTEAYYEAYFVDLFVRKSNRLAISMYEKLGYKLYRRVLRYYQDFSENSAEDAIDMRKPLRAHARRRTSAVVPCSRPVYPHELEWN